jgi:hypothetical protein
MECTWKFKDSPKCTQTATHPQVGNDGSQWANLCTDHAKKLDDGIATGDPKYLLGYWIAAGGGAEAMSKRM